MKLDGVTYGSQEDRERYRATGVWPDLTAGDALRRSAALHGGKTAIATEIERISYAELDEQSERLGAALLEVGLAPGDRAIFQMGTEIETAVALFACYKAGIIPVCSLPQHRAVEIGALTELSGARGHFIQADYNAAFDLGEFGLRMGEQYPSLTVRVIARGAAPDGCHSLEAMLNAMSLPQARARLAQVKISPEQVASFQLSGGTTGLPKIIPRFHAEYLGYSAAWNQTFALGQDDVLLWALPLIHNAGTICFLHPAILVGATLVLMPRFEVESFLRLIERERVTFTGSIGPIAARLLDYPDPRRHDLSSLRGFITLNRAEAIEAHLGVPSSNFYGITEGLLMATPMSKSAEARHHTIGQPIGPADEIKLESFTPDGATGELCFRGSSSLRGYYRNPQATSETLSEEGFVKTQDVVSCRRIDDEIYYSFDGRLKDNIDRGGEKFGTEEIEAMIAGHPAVADAKVVAMPDRHYGEKACAFIIAHPGERLPTVAELGEFLLAQGIAKFKLPERIEAIDAFPETRVGKLDKAALRKMISIKIEEEEAAMRRCG